MFKTKRLSSFGNYGGFSKAEFDGYLRISDYLSLRDGTRLAYDLLLPTKGSVPLDRPLPALFKYTPYLRTFTIFDTRGRNVIAGLFRLKAWEKALLALRYRLAPEKGRFMDAVFRTKWLKTMLEHGYAVIVVERKGTGASFGNMDPRMEVGGREAGEIIDWIASQKWSDGNIGMYGDSFQAMIQFAAAAQCKKNLKAIMPASSFLNGYEALMYRGGIYNKAFGAFFKWAVDFMESEVITPVDGDSAGTLLAQARSERGATLGTRIVEGANKFPYRDDRTKDGELFWESGGDLYPFIDRINESGTPVYLSVGWYDLFTEDMFLWFENLRVPRRLTVRPIDHSGADQSGPDLDYGAEALRWFDYWLKGIENGIMDEPAIHYYAIGAPRSEAWKSSDAWPPVLAKPVEYFFAAGQGSLAGEGSLRVEAQDESVEGADEVLVDYSTTTGKKSRWTAVNWKREYPDMAGNDAKALSYTGETLGSELCLSGSPIARLWLSTEAPELDLFVYLEELDSRGRSRYVTEGELRLTHRKTATAPYSTAGLPFHSHFRSDLEPIPPCRPVLAELALLPVSYIFKRGARIRVAVAFADMDNFETPAILPAPRARLVRGGGLRSSILLPVDAS